MKTRQDNNLRRRADTVTTYMALSLKSMDLGKTIDVGETNESRVGHFEVSKVKGHLDKSF